jgi:hypothetical protein
MKLSGHKTESIYRKATKDSHQNVGDSTTADADAGDFHSGYRFISRNRVVDAGKPQGLISYPFCQEGHRGKIGRG